MPEKRTRTADLSALRIERNAESIQNKNIPHRNRTIVFASIAIIILVLAIYVISTKVKSYPIVQVGMVTTVYPAQEEAILTASGYVVAQRQAAVASKGTGRIEYLGVEEGDTVKKGQIIARLEHNDVDAALEQARANLQIAIATFTQREAEFHEAELNNNRQKNLLEKRLISDSDYDIAEARYKSAEAAVAAAKAQIELAQATVVAAEVDVENTNIRAPFDGTVLTKNADIGEMVAPFAASSNSRGAVATIADMNSLEVEADVSESNIQKVRPGQSCEIILDAFPDHRYPGFVHKIVPTADRAKATVLTKIRFSEPDEKVLPEMSAKVNFFTRTSKENDHDLAPRTAVSKSAVLTRNGEQVVFVVRDNVLIETPISTGKEFGGLIEIIRGASNGDKVVLNPTDDFSSGLKVKVSEKK